MNAALKMFSPVERSSFRLCSSLERISIRLPIAVETPLRPLAPARRTTLAPRPNRSGVSLIEVLIAVFVLTFGLMGIAMVIPAGRFLMVEAAKSDRGSACGRAALNDMKIRGWLDPAAGWSEARVFTSQRSVKEATFYDPAGNPYRDNALVYGETFFIDPLFLTNARDIVGYPTCQFFPYSPQITDSLQFSRLRVWPESAVARRIAPVLPSPTAPQAVAVFDRITTWADDLVFSLESEEQRPRQLLEWVDSSGKSTGAAYPPLPADAFNPSGWSRIRAQNEGKFTWAAMVMPIVPVGKIGPESDIGVWDHDDDSGTPPFPAVKLSSITRYEVSVIVFYQRDFYCPNVGELYPDVDPATAKERSVFARIEGGGIGGGDVLLFIKGDGTGTTSVPDNPRDDYLNVRKNDWIMLKALDASRAVECPSGSNLWNLPTVCKWYRVVNVDDLFDEESDGSGGVKPLAIRNPMDPAKQITGRGRYVTLAGPDWQVNTLEPYTSFDPTGVNADIAEAAIVENVVGVYTTIVDVNSL